MVPLQAHPPVEDQAALIARALAGDVSPSAFAAREPEALAATAQDHGVEGLLWKALQELDSEPARRVEAVLHARARAAVVRDLFTRRDLQAALDALEAAAVPALVIKGAALAYDVYPESWLRPRTDTDVLVRHEDVPAACAALEAGGYVRSQALTSGTLVSHQIAFERPDAHGQRHVVDLHWKIVNPHILADTLDFEVLWRERRPVPALGPAAHAPSLVASAVLACIHRLAHHQGLDRLIWLYDLRLLTHRFDAADWSALERLACGRRVAGLCLDGLLQARERLGGALPPLTESALRRAAPGEPSHRYLEGVVHRRDVLTSDLGVLPSWRDRLTLLREHVFPPPAFIRERYGVKSPILLPVLYVHRLVTGAFKWVWP